MPAQGGGIGAQGAPTPRRKNLWVASRKSHTRTKQLHLSWVLAGYCFFSSSSLQLGLCSHTLFQRVVVLTRQLYRIVRTYDPCGLECPLTPACEIKQVNADTFPTSEPLKAQKVFKGNYSWILQIPK